MNTVILFWNPEISSFKYEDFISDPYLGAHWNGKGGEVYYMDMKIDAAINPLYFPVLPAEELQKLFPAFDWTGGHSGRVLPKIYSPQSLWQRFIEQNKGFFEPPTKPFSKNWKPSKCKSLKLSQRFILRH